MLVIDAVRDKFEIFISEMKDMLYYIENNYTLDEQALSDEEGKFLLQLETQVQDDIAKMIGKIL